MGEITRQPLLSLFLLAVPVSCIHQFYFVHTEGFLHAKLHAPEVFEKIFGVGGSGFMTIGQMTEVIVLGCIPFLAARLSRKTILSIGLIAYAARMALFAYGQDSTALIIAGILLHGPVFGCFIFLSFMIVDEECTPDVRASAQSLYNMVVVGVGVIVGSEIAGRVKDWAGDDYTKLFAVPMWASLGCLVVLWMIYPNRSPSREVQPA
jgi:MFS family permease